MTETTTQEPKVLQVPSTVKSLVEALIFAAREPLTVKQIKAVYEQQAGEGAARMIEADEVRNIINELNEDFQKGDKPYRVVQIAGGYQFATLTQYAEWLGKLYKEQARRKLSQSSIETLAIVAYKQPVSRPEIEGIRGVNCDYVLATLLEKDLVTIVGRAPTAGRPLLYGTTREFLKHFGLNEITDLPRPREIEEILGESQFETERRMLEAQAGATQAKEEEFKSRLPHIPKRKPELDDDVKILPKNKQHELRTRLPEKDIPEDAGEMEARKEVEKQPLTNQFTQQGPPIVGDLHREVASESAEAPREESQEIIQESPAPSDKNLISDSKVQSGQADDTSQVEKEEHVVPQTDSREFQGDMSDNLVRPNSGKLHSQPKEEPPDVGHIERKSTWHAWKEKIQTFIRKLFG